ncbi:hypothetical protein B0H14DRAFT_3695270 [Mycena olivaceomarginata]|nr:hypothetical protein B0H14DRAFT_3695270 [Mycena olivaceomarginata]
MAEDQFYPALAGTTESDDSVSSSPIVRQSTMPPMAASASPRPDSVAEQLSQAALKIYRERPSQDLAELAQYRSTDSDDIMLALEERINTLKDFRGGHWAKVCKKLKPVVQVLLRVTNTVGESESAESIGISGGNTGLAAVVLHDLKEALQNLDDLQEEIKTIMNTYTLVGAEELLPLAKPSQGEKITQLMTMLRTPGKIRKIYTSSLLPGIHQVWNKDLQNIQSVQVDDKIKEWLLGDQFRTADPGTDRNAALKKRQQGTGDWLLRNSDFKNWRSLKEKSVLWLQGSSTMTAGSGKTILSAYLVDELLHSIPDLAYFFFRVKVREDLESMLSSTLLQLASGQERHKILLDAYNSDKCKGPPSRSMLLTYFKTMLTVPHNLVLVIDALDEHPKPRDELLGFLSELIQNHHNHIHLLVASRDEPDIRAGLQNIGAVEVDLNKESNQKNDLCKYITRVLQSDEPFREWKDSYPHTVDLIKHRLLKENIAPIDVEGTLKTLPHSLVEMYEHILQSLESKHPKTAQRVMHVFELISCASRSLSVDEAAEVFAVQFNLDNSVQILEEHRLKNPAIELVEKCTSAFIRIEDSTVQFAHASVLEYLRNPGVSRATPWLDPASAKITLSKLCLCTIHSVIQPSTPRWPTGPFDNYAREFWLQATAHALSHKSHSPEIEGDRQYTWVYTGGASGQDSENQIDTTPVCIVLGPV